MSASEKFLLENVLLPDGWARNVTVEVSRQGDFVRVGADADHDRVRDMGATPGDNRISGWVVPGMPNCHSHAHQRAIAGLGEKAALNPVGTAKTEDSFWTWRSAMYHMLQRIQPDHLHAICRQLYLEMLQAGYTHVGEFQYLHHDPAGQPYGNRAEMTLQCMHAATDMGIGFTALPVLYRYGGFGAQSALPEQKRFLNDADQFCNLVEAVFAAVKQSGHGNFAVGIAPHSLRAVSAALLSEVTDNLDSVPLAAIHLHVAEQSREVDDCLAWSGQRPVQWLLERFAVDRQWCLIHATHTTEKEIGDLAATGAVVGLCPTTEANLGDGFFDLPRYHAAGGSWAIGSDSHISVSPVEELRWLEYGLRLQKRQRNVMANIENRHTGMALYRQALAGGEQSSGRKIGRIQPGYRADFVVLDPAHPCLTGKSDGQVIDSWIFSGNQNPVRDVYVAGQKVIDGGRHRFQETVAGQYRETIAELADQLP